MENYQEIIKTYVTRYILLLFLFGMPTCSQIVVAGDIIESARDEPIEPDLPLISNEEDAVGTPNGAVSVNSTGAAVYNLKIDAPNGGSLTPQISLSYNSQSGGYGLAGYGFSITGISAITRGGHDLFHDGRQAGVTYTASDNLFLDGKRLILKSGTSGQNGAIYTVKGDPYTTVVVHGNYNNSSTTTWFEVTTNTGMTYQYGNSSNSKVAYKNKSGYSRIASWYVNKVTDRYDNYITYEYSVSNLSIRPTTIAYGTNSSKSRGIVNKVSFTYQSLGNNYRPFAIEDQQGKTDMCLSAITTTSNNSVYRKYTFSYDDNSDLSAGKWTRLVTVEEENGKGEKLRPIKFTWQYLPSSTIRSSQLDATTKDGKSIIKESDKQFLSADLNGDGISDIIRISQVMVETAFGYGSADYDLSTYVYVSRSKRSTTGNITYDTPIIYDLPAVISIDNYKYMLGGSSVMDFNGDGYNDLVIPSPNSNTGNWNHPVLNIILGSDVVNGSGNKLRLPFDIHPTDRTPLFAILDVDGNGKDDVVCVEQVKKGNYYPCTIVELVDKKGLKTTKTTDVKLILPQNVNEEIEKIYTGDYNNDGLPDLILLYNGGYKIYFNNGGTTVDTRFTESNTKSGTNFGNFWRIQQGDFDGDGLSDFVYNKAGETFLWIAHNNGNGTFTNTKTVDIGVGDHASNQDDSRFALMTYDIDHDGRTDVMVCKAGYVHRGFPKFKNEYTNTQVKWLYSTGSSLKLANSYTKNREDDAKESYIFLGDFDGDGSMELANYGSALNSSSNSFAEKINIYQTGYNLPQVGKITCITDGMGNSKHFQYASATSPTVYKKIIDNPSSNTYPINTYTLPLHVVKKVTSENGSAGNQVTNYRYENFTLHIAGGGMLGFKAMITENVTLNTKDSCITQWNTEFLIPSTIKKTNIVGNSTSTIISNYTISPVGNNYFAYVSNEDVTDLDGNKSSIDTSYDIEKGVITDKTVKNDGDNMYKKVAYSDFQNKCGIWLPKTMVMSQKHADDPVPYTSVTTYSYDDKGNVLTSAANSGTNMALKTTSTYDVYGNVLSSVTTGNGVKAITKYNEYDTSGRFVIKSYTSPASAVNTFTYDLWGNVLTETDATDPANNLTTTYTYDGWGRKQTALQADGTKTTWATGWGVSGSKKYFIMEFTTGKPSVTTWYDKAGNEVLQLSFGPKGISVSKSTSYNRQGQVSCVVNKMGKLTTTQNQSYDERGRIDEDTQSSGKSVSYTYGNRSVTTHVAGRSYTKVSDAWGNIIKSVDPVSEVEYRYYSIGKPSSVTTGGATVTMTYDEAGNQLTLSDPDAGTTTYTYAADGTLLTQTDGRGVKTTNSYDNLARLASTRIGQSTTVYTYGTTGNEKLRLTRLSSGNNSVEYTHDKYGRVVTEKRHVDGNGTYSFSYSYNSNNQLAKTTYPGGLEVDYQYDSYGFKSQSAIGDKVIYKLESTDGLVSSTSFMGQLTTTRTRNAQGYEINRKITHGSSIVENFDAAYDGVTDNLLSRKRNSGPTETFGYDNLDRLVSVKSNATETMRINYAPNGNILSKTGVGDFTYDENLRPHAVIEVENANGEIPSDALSTTFNDFGRIQMIEDAGKGFRMDLHYGPDQERWCSELSRNGTDVRTTVYAGEYEKITENGTTREYYYLDGNTIVVKENGVFKNFLAFTDNIGSILSVIYEDGAKVFDASYDVWGRQTVTRNTIGLHRGYTGHEMLSEFDIINMNGRLYDPVLGRFFSPDNFVQMPDNSQNFNRYSYCLNNPLKYTDPSGNLFGIDDAVIAFAVFNMANSMMQAAYEGKSVWKAGAFSLLSSAVTYGIGEAFKGAANTFGNELLRAGAHGLSSGVFSALDGGNFASAFVSGATASGMGSYAQAVSMNTGLMIASTTAMGGAVAWLTGGEFLQGAMNGMQIAILNHSMHDGDNDGDKKRSQQKLKKEIEKDGILTFKEARQWYREGDGSAITVDADKIDLNFLDVSTLTEGKKKPVQTWSGGIGQGLVYGGITVEYKGNNQIQISPDKYNFEMHPWDSFKESMRNIETLIARPIHGKGISFPIYFRGLNTIHHAPATDNRPYVWSQYSWSRHF